MPVLFLAESPREEQKNLIQAMNTRLTNYGETIAVLFPQQRQVFGYAQGLRAAGIEVEVHRFNAPLDVSNRLPKLMTYHQAKGLTFDSVFLPRLVQGSFYGRLRDRLDHLLFVGISRAVKWVYLSGTNGALVPPLYSLWQENTNGYQKQFKSDGIFEPSSEEPELPENAADDFGLD
ncbi:3'-5' exonuclease [Methylomagnum sp.]